MFFSFLFKYLVGDLSFMELMLCCFHIVPFLGGIYTAGQRSNAQLNASCLGHITNATFAAAGVISTSCCSTGSKASEARLLTQSRESLMNLVELRRPVRDAASAKLAKLRRVSPFTCLPL